MAEIPATEIVEACRKFSNQDAVDTFDTTKLNFSPVCGAAGIHIISFFGNHEVFVNNSSVPATCLKCPGCRLKPNGWKAVFDQHSGIYIGKIR